MHSMCDTHAPLTYMSLGNTAKDVCRNWVAICECDQRWMCDKFTIPTTKLLYEIVWVTRIWENKKKRETPSTLKWMNSRKYIVAVADEMATDHQYLSAAELDVVFCINTRPQMKKRMWNMGIEWTLNIHIQFNCIVFHTSVSHVHEIKRVHIDRRIRTQSEFTETNETYHRSRSPHTVTASPVKCDTSASSVDCSTRWNADNSLTKYIPYAEHA